jgi:hypothetical protein
MHVLVRIVSIRSSNSSRFLRNGNEPVARLLLVRVTNDADRPTVLGRATQEFRIGRRSHGGRYVVPGPGRSAQLSNFWKVANGLDGNGTVVFVVGLQHGTEKVVLGEVLWTKVKVDLCANATQEHVFFVGWELVKC